MSAAGSPRSLRSPTPSRFPDPDGSASILPFPYRQPRATWWDRFCGSLSDGPLENLARDRSQLCLALVVVVAAVLAAILGDRFLAQHRHLWWSISHDRNAHYAFGLTLANHVQRWDLVGAIRDLDGARMWPPLHGVLVAVTQVLSGNEERLAVLPSLMGWAALLVFGFLVARRVAGRYGNLAGFTTLVFLASSPAYKAYATDIMLESVGAALSMAALYFYLVAVQDRDRAAAVRLGLTLTLLMLQKYNYWLLVCLALTISELSLHGRAYWDLARAAARPWQSWATWRAQLLQPLHYAILGLAALLVAATLSDEPWHVLGRTTSAPSPITLISLIYACAFVRLLLWWRAEGRTWTRGFDPRWRSLIAWHLWPMAIWLLWPKKMAYFMKYLLANPGENAATNGWLAGLRYHAGGIVNEYHLGLVSAAAAAVLVGVALLYFQRWRPGGLAIVVFLGLAFMLTIPHENRKTRFVHSWLAASWVLAGVGVASLAGAGGWQRWAAGAALAGVLAIQGPGLLTAGRAVEGGTKLNRPSLLEVTDAYLPTLQHARHPMILSNMPMKHLARWTYLQRYGNADHLEGDIKNYGDTEAQNREAFQAWLASTKCDTLVFVDVATTSKYHEITPYVALKRLPALLSRQPIFHLTKSRYLPDHGITVQIWQRGTPEPPPAAATP